MTTIFSLLALTSEKTRACEKGYLEDKQWDLINFGREKKRYTKNNRKKIGIEPPHLPY